MEVTMAEAAVVKVVKKTATKKAAITEAAVEKVIADVAEWNMATGSPAEFQTF